ncbi:ankyrin repeat-containing domain protein [Aspergillus venezuelensis]
MASAIAISSRLKPEIRLGQVISEFQADLSSAQKATFRAHHTRAAPPSIRDVMQLTAEINRSTGLSGRCFGSRLMNILKAVQQFAALGDIVLGGAQNLLASGVWTIVRITLLSVVTYAAYFERLSAMLMAAGRSAPRYQLLGALYPKSEKLRGYIMEYFIVLVKLCRHVIRLSRKSVLGQWASSLSDVLDTHQAELEVWATSIKEEVDAEENSRFRAHLWKRLEIRSHATKFKAKKRQDWKRLRKMGNTTLTQSGNIYGPKTLICTGKLGSGNLDPSQTTTVAYFFCQHDISESLKACTVIGSLARQLLQSETEFDDHIDIHLGPGSSLSLDRIVDLLKGRLQPKYKAYFLLDGLTHCDPSTQVIIIDALRVLQNVACLDVCISVRLEPANILEELKQLSSATVLAMPEENKDIDVFVNAELQRRVKSGQLAVNDPLLVIEMEEKLCQGAHGMFLWVALQIEALCLQPTDAHIRKAIADLPKDLSAIYRFILESSHREYQVKVLGLVMSARRPLKTEEIRDALSVTPGQTTWNPRERLNDIEAILGCCGGLITVDEEDSSVRSIHPSVRTFLCLHPELELFTPDRGERMMGEVILTYLNYSYFAGKLSRQRSPQVLASALTSSVTRTAVESIGQSQKLALRLLKMKKRADREIGRDLLDLTRPLHDEKTAPLAFYNYASSWWQHHIWCSDLPIPEMEEMLIGMLQAQDIERRDPYGRTPLSHCAESGYHRNVEWLLAHGALHQADDSGCTPLHWAVKSEHAFVVEALLNSKGCDPNVKDLSGKTPIDVAVEAKSHAVFTSLLDCARVDQDYQGSEGSSLLMFAAAHDFAEGIKSILERQIYDDQRWDNNGDTPLHVAATHGSREAIDVLLSNEPAKLLVNTQNSKGCTPLYLAAANGHREIVRILTTNSDADYTISDNRSSVVEYLLQERGLNVSDRDIYGDSLVSLAVKNGHVSTVRLLMHGYRLTWIAASKGYTDILALLARLDDAEIDAPELGGKTPLWIAASNGHDDVVEFLILQEEIEVNHRDARGRSPLWVAASHGRTEVVHLQDRAKGVTPLWIAASNGRTDVVKVLLSLEDIPIYHRNVTRTASWFAIRHRPDINFLGPKSCTPLMAAAANGREGVVLLLAGTENIDFNHKDPRGETALFKAAANGHAGVVQILVHELSPRTPFLTAIERNNVAIAHIFIGCPRFIQSLRRHELDLVSIIAEGPACPTIDAKIKKFIRHTHRFDLETRVYSDEHNHAVGGGVDSD